MLVRPPLVVEQGLLGGDAPAETSMPMRGRRRARLGGRLGLDPPNCPGRLGPPNCPGRLEEEEDIVLLLAGRGSSEIRLTSDTIGFSNDPELAW